MTARGTKTHVSVSEHHIFDRPDTKTPISVSTMIIAMCFNDFIVDKS